VNIIHNIFKIFLVAIFSTALLQTAEAMAQLNKLLRKACQHRCM
jgi:hypothetical protein